MEFELINQSERIKMNFSEQMPKGSKRNVLRRSPYFQNKNQRKFLSAFDVLSLAENVNKQN